LNQNPPPLVNLGKTACLTSPLFFLHVLANLRVNDNKIELANPFYDLVSSGRALHVSIVKTTRRSRVFDKSFTKKPKSPSRLIKSDEIYFLEDIFMAIL
jgi:hypothetical protein